MDAQQSSGTEEAGKAPGYTSGVCNIGKAEIANRRVFGHMGVLVAAVLFDLFLFSNAPHAWRLLVALPAAAAAIGYLQARSHFCAGLGSRGVYNFGPLGQRTQVADDADRKRDFRRSRLMALQALSIGAAVGVILALLPVR